jgi:fructose-1,6-bisphosphatase I
MVSGSFRANKERWLIIWNLAGGQAVDSHMNRMIEVVPEHIHDRSGIFMGSYDEVQKVIDIHAKFAAK